MEFVLLWLAKLVAASLNVSAASLDVAVASVVGDAQQGQAGGGAGGWRCWTGQSWWWCLSMCQRRHPLVALRPWATNALAGTNTTILIFFFIIYVLLGCQGQSAPLNLDSCLKS